MREAPELIEFVLSKFPGLSQAAVAAEVGVSRQLFTEWKTGRSYPRPPQLELIKNKLGVSWDELMETPAPMQEESKKHDTRQRTNGQTGVSKEQLALLRLLLEAKKSVLNGFDDEALKAIEDDGYAKKQMARVSEMLKKRKSRKSSEKISIWDIITAELGSK
ncbi:MAG: helix-turn-helix transcriptional regulator [Planctomycetes bacterium]|nr:helix-turn-helix transcriptional regulator [Planctomycetota bacterium]